MAEGGPQQAAEVGNRDVVDARAGLIAQIANSWRVGLVSDHIQRRTRQIKKQRVIGLVEENGGISLQVMETTLANPQVTHRRSSAIPNIPNLENREVAKRREKHLPAESNRSFPAADYHIELP